MNAALAVFALSFVVAAPSTAGSRVEIQHDTARFEAPSGLELSCHPLSYLETGRWRLSLRLPSRGFAPETPVRSLFSASLRDRAACEAVAALGTTKHRGHTSRRVFDVHRVEGGRCIRELQEEFELTIDGSGAPLSGTLRFRIGARPMHECTGP
ncbi:MAG: hypothetical protein AAF721_07275 [Myxococcota bacterium]